MECFKWLSLVGLLFAQPIFCAKQYEDQDWAIDLFREKEKYQQENAFLSEQQKFYSQRGEAAIKKREALQTQLDQLFSAYGEWLETGENDSTEIKEKSRSYKEECCRLLEKHQFYSNEIRLNTEKLSELKIKKNEVSGRLSAWVDAHNAIVFHNKAA